MHFHTPDTTTLTPESPPACPGSASFLVVSGLPAQGDFLSHQSPRFFCPVCSWSGDTCRECPACGAADVQLSTGDFIANWFDSQTEDTCRFWIDRAVEMFGLPDSATPRQCWDAFCAFATRAVLAPQLLTHAAVIRKHGQPLFTVHCPPGMLHLGNVAPFWSAKAFEGYLAALRARGYFVTRCSGSAAAFVLPSRGAV